MYENTLDSEKKLNKEEINFVSLKMIPEIEKILNQVKKEKTISNKSINKFVINEQKITEYIRISGDKSYSFLIENNSPEEYVVENLVIFFQDDEYVSYITKWIPSDGKPFYNLKNFKGELQYLDLNDKLIHSVKIGDKKTSKSNQTSKTLEQYAFTFGCWDYVIADYGNGAFILSSNNHCGDNGGGTSSGGTSTGGIGGSTSTTSGGGGGGYTGTGTTTFVPNIPTEDVVEAKMYKTFLTSLKPEQLNFLGYYTNVNKEIFDYLAEHNFASANKIVAKKMIHAAFITNYLGSSATTDFINWGSDYLIKNPDVTWGQFENWFMGIDSFEVNPKFQGSNFKIFSNSNDLQAFMEQLKTINSDVSESNVVTTLQNQKWATKTIKLTPIIDLTIEIVSNTGSPFTFDKGESKTFISNPVVGNSWVQNSIFLVNDSYSSTEAKLAISGYINVGIKMGELEFGIKQRKLIELLVNKSTGKICCVSVSNIKNK